MPKKRKQNNHLAEGEVTGHYHEATGKVAVFEGEYGDTSLLLDAPEGSVVTHQEHNEVTLPPGKYRSGIVQEYDHLEEEARNVAD